MKNIEARVSMDEARQIDMVDYLSKFGHYLPKLRTSIKVY